MKSEKKENETDLKERGNPDKNRIEVWIENGWDGTGENH